MSIDSAACLGAICYFDESYLHTFVRLLTHEHIIAAFVSVCVNNQLVRAAFVRVHDTSKQRLLIALMPGAEPTDIAVNVPWLFLCEART